MAARCLEQTAARKEEEERDAAVAVALKPPRKGRKKSEFCHAIALFGPLSFAGGAMCHVWSSVEERSMWKVCVGMVTVCGIRLWKSGVDAVIQGSRNDHL